MPATGNTDCDTILRSLANQLEGLSPEVQKAATFVLENPREISISSIRELASAAQVKPTTLVRLAHNCGYSNYEDFRSPFRDEVRQGPTHYQNRADWLQSLSRKNELGELYASMALSSMQNIEQTFSATDAASLKRAAKAIVASRRTYLLGVGLNYSLARTFSYLASMALDHLQAIPSDGNSPIDDLAHAASKDVLLAITFKPYRSEVVQAVQTARNQKVTIIGISDSAASPIISSSEHGFIVRTETPQFFPSISAATALMEALLAFVIADAKPAASGSIKRFHDRRHQLGIYHAGRNH